MNQLNDTLARKILDSSADAFVAMDTRGYITEWNKAAEKMFGWTRTEAIGRTVAETIIPMRYREGHEQGIQHFRATGIAASLGQVTQVPAQRRDGHEFPVELTRWSLEQAGEVQFYSFIRDVSEREQRKRKLEQQAYYDELTGLPNRRLLLQLLEQQLAPNNRRQDSSQEGLAVLFVDLDHFKRINDSLGHTAGDQALVTVANRLRNAVRPADTVARLAGDEFVILCPGMRTHRNASIAADRILSAIDSPIVLGTDSVFLTASVGIAFADEGDSAEAIVSAADNAMYHAKASGRAGYELFNPQMRQEVSSRLQVENELRVALERNQLEVYFQPIVIAAAGNTVAAEALLRWNHPERGLLLPAEFIPIAEETGLIVPIGEWVLEEACRHAQTWINAVDEHVQLYVSVNLSARQLAQANLVSVVERTLAKAAFDPKRVQFGLEITESVVMRDPAATAAVLKQLKGLGAHLSIDDFGTGYSSLAYLKNLPVDTLKIDRSFILNIAEDNTDFCIVKTIVDLAHALHLTVVAEGIETPEQERAVRRANVDLIQGFLYGRPQPLDQLIRWHQSRETGQKLTESAVGLFD